MPDTTSSPLPALFATFHGCAAQALQQDDKWLIIDPVYEHMELLAAQPLEQLLPHILQLIGRDEASSQEDSNAGEPPRESSVDVSDVGIH